MLKIFIYIWIQTEFRWVDIKWDIQNRIWTHSLQQETVIPFFVCWDEVDKITVLHILWGDYNYRGLYNWQMQFCIFFRYFNSFFQAIVYKCVSL